MKDEPDLADISIQFLEFIRDSILVAHNNLSDLALLNLELERIGHGAIQAQRVHCTKKMVKTFSTRSRRTWTDCPGVLHNALEDSALTLNVHIVLNRAAERALVDRAARRSAERNIKHSRNIIMQYLCTVIGNILVALAIVVIGGPLLLVTLHGPEKGLSEAGRLVYIFHASAFPDASAPPAARIVKR